MIRFLNPLKCNSTSVSFYMEGGNVPFSAILFVVLVSGLSFARPLSRLGELPPCKQALRAVKGVVRHLA